MLDTTSMFALGCVVGLAIAALGMWAMRRWDRPSPLIAYLEAHAVRFAVAQHWARGALLSDASEPWRPIVSAAAIAAVALEDGDSLLAHINAIVGSVSVTTDPQVANVWRQVQAELIGCRMALTGEFLAGVRADGSPSWSHQAIGLRTAELLEMSTERGSMLVRARSVPPPPGPLS